MWKRDKKEENNMILIEIFELCTWKIGRSRELRYESR
jgi:hypothetical protein